MSDFDVEVLEAGMRPGTFLCGGRYRIVRFLSQGGFGCTYEAEHVSLHKRVAIKEFFPKDWCNREPDTLHVTVGTQSKRKLIEKLHDKFVREAQAVAQFKHHGIVKVSDVFEENGTAYYVMDYIEGGSLKDKVRAVGRLSEADAVRYIRQVCDALAYVHSLNCLHLDIKPANIMIDDEGRAVLIDFGASKQYDEVSGENTSSLLGQTPGYAPPEQTAQVVRTFYPATDIYAVGATLYNMLTGVTPKTSNERISGDELDPLPPDVSAGTRAAIEAAMRLNKQKRPQSVSEFLALLGGDEPKPPVLPQKEDGDTVILSEPINVMSPPAGSSIETDGDHDSKKRRVALVAVLVGVVVAVLVVVSLYSAWGSSSPIEPGSVQDSVSIDSIAPETSSGSINVTCGPKGATIKIDGTKVGTTPKEIEGLSVGEHRVVVSKSGYESRSWTVNVKANGTIYLSDDLDLVEQTTASGTKPTSTSGSSTSSSSPSSSSSSYSSSSSTSLSSNANTKGGTINKHEYVDLGLSVKWATCNLGASSSSGYGNFYAWGETSTKPSYTDSNSQTYGKDGIGNISGNSRYDAARANWGGSWRMPTRSEMQELVNKCTWTWTGSGYNVTGPSGNSIYLPAAGDRYGDGVIGVGQYGDYWTSTPNGSEKAYFLDFISSSYKLNDDDDRSWGHTIRPVSN